MLYRCTSRGNRAAGINNMAHSSIVVPPNVIMNHAHHKSLNTNICVYGRESTAGNNARKATIMNSHRPTEEKITALNNPEGIQNLEDFFNPGTKKYIPKVTPVRNPYVPGPYAKHFNPPPPNIPDPYNMVPPMTQNPYLPVVPRMPMYNPYMVPRVSHHLPLAYYHQPPNPYPHPYPASPVHQGINNTYHGSTVTINNNYNCPPISNPYKKSVNKDVSVVQELKSADPELFDLWHEKKINTILSPDDQSTEKKEPVPSSALPVELNPFFKLPVECGYSSDDNSFNSNRGFLTQK